MASVKSIPDEDRNRPLWLAGTALVLLIALAPAFYRLFLKPAVEARAEAGQIVLRYMARGQPQQINIEREIIARFNEKCRKEGKNVRVEFFMPPAAGYPQKMRMMLASNDAPDVMRVDHYEFPSLVPKGCFYDLTDLAKNDPDFDPEGVPIFPGDHCGAGFSLQTGRLKPAPQLSRPVLWARPTRTTSIPRPCGRTCTRAGSWA